MEPRFGHNFSRVRVHTDDRAAKSARAVNALAYTAGQHIVFGTQQHALGSPQGRRLLAHELTHVVQQSGSAYTSGNSSAAMVRHALEIGPAHDTFEREAEHVAADIGSPSAFRASPTSEQRLQRDTIDDPLSSQRSGTPLPYREAMELLECIRILGEGSADYCRQEVLGEPIPPMPTHHQLAGITTPQPINVRLNPDGTANFQVNGVNVVFNPDVHNSDPAMANKAETKFDITYGAINWVSTGGHITSFTGPGIPQATIRTTYGPGVTRPSPSGYGRGTTATDVAAGETSLGFHEGRHGLDFVEFLSQDPFPRFLGRVGMTTAQFQSAIIAYESAITRYRERMNRFSELRTDCVGRTIDESNRDNGFTTSICRQTPAASGGERR
jgi:hypothetical protein